MAENTTSRPSYIKDTIIKSLIHISPGTIPSQSAHTVQIMKMAESLSGKVKNFELITSGDLVSIVTGTKPDLREWYGLRRQFRVVRIPSYLSKMPGSTHRCGGRLYYLLASLYSRIKSPTLIYMRSYKGIEITLKRTNLPLIWEHHTILPDTFFSNIVKYRNLIGFISTTSELGDIAIENGMPPEKVLIEQSAVDIENFLPYKTKQEARSDLGIAENSPLVAYVGHLYDKKGIPTILDLAELMPRCEFILVGGWEKDVSRVRENGLKRRLNNIRLIGHVTQSSIPKYLYAADVLLLPTNDHPDHTFMGSQLKLFEYMASRRPIVASDLPSIRTVMRDGYNVILAEPGNARAFEAGINKLINDPKLSGHISEQAFKCVQYYTWDKRADRILSFAKERLSEYLKLS